MKLLVLADIDGFQWQGGRVEVLKHLGNLPDVGAKDVRAIHPPLGTDQSYPPGYADDWCCESSLQTIEKMYKELSVPDHPVSIAMEKQKTVPEVRIIEGLDK